jgi:hypothetical protein
MFFIAVKIAEGIKKALSPIAISIAYMPSQIEHLNLRIYPYFENEIPAVENKPIEVKPEELKSIAGIIRNNIRIERQERKNKKRLRKKKEGGKRKAKKRGRDFLVKKGLANCLIRF